MNTGWCRNDLNHAKNQSRVEKNCTKIQVSIDFLRNVAKEYNPELQISEYKFQLCRKLIAIIVIIIVGNIFYQFIVTFYCSYFVLYLIIITHRFLVQRVTSLLVYAVMCHSI